MPDLLPVPGGTIAFESTGDGPLVVLAHGIGDTRAAFRGVAAALVDQGFRVVTADLRGCGESSARWTSFTQADIAGDLMALTRHLGGRAVLVGHSISGGAATIAAARAPELFDAVVELAPYTRRQHLRLSDLRHGAYRRAALRLLGAAVLRSPRLWRAYLELAHPGAKPADWAERLAGIDAMLQDPARRRALQRMCFGGSDASAALLPGVRLPVLVVAGSLDPDWVAPVAEAEAVVRALLAGGGTVRVVTGAGHYPHAQFPDETAALIADFVRTVRA